MEDTSLFDVTALGEILIDFTPCGKSAAGQRIFEQNPGGAPANVLTCLSKFDKKTAFLGKIGKDMHGAFLKSVLEDNQINTEGLAEDDSVFTTLAFVALSESGERSFSFARKPGADTCLTEAELKKDIIKDSKILHIGSLSLTADPSKSTTFAALETAKEHGVVVSYDPNYRAPLWDSKQAAMDGMRSVLSFVDVMKLSDEETALLTDEAEPEKAAKKLLEKGISIVAVTLGADGALVCTKEGSITVPGYKADMVDTTGAGDSFWGGFLNQLIESGKKPCDVTLEEAAAFVKFGNAVASLCVEKRGAIPAMPAPEDVAARLNR